MTRKFKVAESKNADTKKVTRLYVTDAEGPEELGSRPDVAIFPVSERYDEEEQLRHARLFADYLNKVNEAKNVAYEQTMILDILKK